MLAGVTLTQISAGTASTCALSAAGPAYCWGLGTSGQLGNGASSSSNVPVTVTASSGALSGVTLTGLSVGGSSACVLSAAGAAYCWGLGTSGQLGNGASSTSNVAVPVSAGAVPAATPLTQISVGGSSACALSEAGLGYCWGLDTSGQLGNNSTTLSNVPVAVSVAGVLAGVSLTQISTGYSNFTCALGGSGAAYCWGSNTSGQVGNAATAPATGGFLVPVAVTTVPTLVSAGNGHSCMLRSGKAYCWGDNADGDLGNNSTGNSSVPVPVWTGGALCGGHPDPDQRRHVRTCALSSAGAVVLLGENACRAGQQLAHLSSVPVAVYTGGVLAGVTVTQVSVGGGVVCVLSSAGAAYCWGAGASGSLGNGSTTGVQPTPVAVSAGAVPVGAILTQISVKSVTACVLSSAGAAYCWGYGANGQMGNGTTTSSNSLPVAVTLAVPLIQISAGYVDTCALAATGAGYCWGQNGYGGLGTGLNAGSDVPLPVWTGGVLAGVTLTQITTGNSIPDFTCALSSAGAAYCWGSNGQGELGNNLVTWSTTPMAVFATGVLSGVTLAQIETGATHVCAMDTTGAVYCWGDNAGGDLGNGSTTQSSVPVATSGISGIIPGLRRGDRDGGGRPGGHLVDGACQFRDRHADRVYGHGRRLGRDLHLHHHRGDDLHDHRPDQCGAVFGHGDHHHHGGQLAAKQPGECHADGGAGHHRAGHRVAVKCRARGYGHRADGRGDRHRRPQRGLVDGDGVLDDVCRRGGDGAPDDPADQYLLLVGAADGDHGDRRLYARAADLGERGGADRAADRVQRDRRQRRQLGVVEPHAVGPGAGRGGGRHLHRHDHPLGVVTA